MASPSSARGPRSTAPASPSAISAAPAIVRPMPAQPRREGGSPSKGPARTPTNRGEQATSTVEEATVVRASEAFQSEKCSARHAPDSASQPRSRRSGTPLEPAGTAAPLRNRRAPGALPQNRASRPLRLRASGPQAGAQGEGGQQQGSGKAAPEGQRERGDVRFPHQDG